MPTRGSTLYFRRLEAWTGRRAHAHTGDPAVIAGYMGRRGAFDDALASFAMGYAEQTVRDHPALVKAKGDSEAETPTKNCELGREAGREA